MASACASSKLIPSPSGDRVRPPSIPTAVGSGESEGGGDLVVVSHDPEYVETVRSRYAGLGYRIHHARSFTEAAVYVTQVPRAHVVTDRRGMAQMLDIPMPHQAVVWQPEDEYGID